MLDIPQKTFLNKKIALLFLFVFIGLSVGLSLTKRPWSDEGWFAAAGYNLAYNGKPGTLVLEPRGYREGIDRYTYWTAPLYYPLQAIWYRIFGFSLFSMRSLSTLFGVILILSLFVVSKQLFQDEAIALLTTVLLSLDYVVVMGASFGRMDIICAALGWSSIATYFLLRNRSIPLALFCGQTLVALSGLTHFLGVIYFVAFWIIVISFDRYALTFKSVMLSFFPYLIGSLAWGAYIMQAPELFLSQFGGNAADGGRLNLLTDPISAIYREISDRYIVAYGLASHSAGSSGPVWLKSVVLFAYLLALFLVITIKELRTKPGVRISLLLLAVFFMIMTILDGQKLTYYLLNIVPLFSMILASATVYSLRHSLMGKLSAVSLVTGMLLVQFGGIILKIKSNGYEKQYSPVAQFIKSNSDPGDVTYGSAEIAFALGFDGNVVDDHWLGYERNRKPKFFILEEVYEEALDGRRRDLPEVYTYVIQTLEREYDLVYDKSHYRIFQRRDSSANTGSNSVTSRP